MTLKIANHFSRIQKFDAALDIYKNLAESETTSKLLKEIVTFNMNYCKKKSSAITSLNFIENLNFDITLTTISSRIINIDKVIASLINQKIPASKIFVYISKEPYLLDEGIPDNITEELQLKFKDKVHFVYTENIGPYRKIFPYLQYTNSINKNNESLFITVDDDTIYPDYFTQQLLENFCKFNCIVAFRGRELSINNKKLNPYSEWKRGTTSPSFKNIPTGKDGVLYSTKFFPEDFVNIDAAKILAPTADDLWIKWNTTLFGIKSVILNPEACDSDYNSFPLVDYSKESREKTLYMAHNHSSGGSKNDAAIKSLEDYFENINFNLIQLINASNAI